MMTRFLGLIAALLACAGGCAPPPPPEDVGLPPEVTVNAGVGVQYAQAAAVAAVIEKHTPMKAFVEPTKSHVAAMPLFQRPRDGFHFR